MTQQFTATSKKAGAIGKLITASMVVGASLIPAFANGTAVQAQMRPIGIMPRTPGVGYLNNFPKYPGNDSYDESRCRKYAVRNYGGLIRAIPYPSGKLTCQMEYASFLLQATQR
jgi:hypothetical protein